MICDILCTGKREKEVKDQDKAPLPSKPGLMKNVATTVDSLGGAHLDQINQYLPAQLINGEETPTKKQLTTCLTNCVYHGYMSKKKIGGVTYWFRATAAYYKLMHDKRLQANAGVRRRRRARQTYRKNHPGAKRRPGGRKQLAAKANLKVANKPNGVLAAMDADIKKLEVEARALRTKIVRLNVLRTKYVNWGM